MDELEPPRNEWLSPRDNPPVPAQEKLELDDSPVTPELQKEADPTFPYSEEKVVCFLRFRS